MGERTGTCTRARIFPPLLPTNSQFTGKENRPTEKPKTMSLGEWQKLLEGAGLMDGEIFGDRACRLCYVRSMQTSEDELTDDTAHRKLKMVEFYEAIARVAQHRMVNGDADHPLAPACGTFAGFIAEVISAMFKSITKPKAKAKKPDEEKGEGGGSRRGSKELAAL
mmetsp:Transcript_6210/g.15521  ORF Transcript_6210/g.15521 Transcript_6210/m.15521 type:complete len:166 (+) Transcript_6210:3959-4456(+)